MFMNEPGYRIESEKCYTTVDVPTGHVYELSANFSTMVLKDDKPQHFNLSLWMTVNKGTPIMVAQN